MAKPVERIHIIRKTPPMALGSPHAIKSLENIIDIITMDNNQRNQLDLNIDGIGLFRLTNDKKRSWKAPMGQSQPQ